MKSLLTFATGNGSDTRKESRNGCYEWHGWVVLTSTQYNFLQKFEIYLVRKKTTLLAVNWPARQIQFVRRLTLNDLRSKMVTSGFYLQWLLCCSVAQLESKSCNEFVSVKHKCYESFKTSLSLLQSKSEKTAMYSAGRNVHNEILKHAKYWCTETTHELYVSKTNFTICDFIKLIVLINHCQYMTMLM